MPSRYDENSKAKSVRLVREHAGEAPAHITPAWRNGSPRAQRNDPTRRHTTPELAATCTYLLLGLTAKSGLGSDLVAERHADRACLRRGLNLVE